MNEYNQRNKILDTVCIKYFTNKKFSHLIKIFMHTEFGRPYFKYINSNNSLHLL